MSFAAGKLFSRPILVCHNDTWAGLTVCTRLSGPSRVFLFDFKGPFSFPSEAHLSLYDQSGTWFLPGPETYSRSPFVPDDICVPTGGSRLQDK